MSARGAEGGNNRLPWLSRRSSSTDMERLAMRVLIIDADSVSAGRLAEILRPTHDVFSVTTAAGALASITDKVPDLIITEIRLPDANGVQLVGQLRREPATRHTLFIICTGHQSVQEKIAAFQAGADDYLVKPMTPDDFLLHVRSVSRFRRLIHGPLTGQTL
jgi:two-component system, OmpR family, response regulator